jgi:hypothetical protein
MRSATRSLFGAIFLFLTAATQAADTLPPATLLSLKLNEVPAADAFATLLAEAGLSLEGRSRQLLIPREKPVTLNLEERPFWQALKELCDKTQVDVDEVQENGLLRLRDAAAKPGVAPWAVNGPAALIINRIDARRTLSYMRAFEPDSTCTFAIRPLAEGSFKPRLYRIERVEPTVTDAQEPVTLFEQYFSSNYFAHPAWRQHAFMLKMPEVMRGRKLPRLTVTVRYVMELQTKTLEIDNLLQAAGAEHDVVNFKFKVAEAAPTQASRFKFTFELSRAGRPAQEWREFADLSTQFTPKILDADGKPLQMLSGGGGGGPDMRRFDQTVTTQRGAGGGAVSGPPHKLVWEYPVDAKTLDVKFEFTDVPIP